MCEPTGRRSKIDTIIGLLRQIHVNTQHAARTHAIIEQFATGRPIGVAEPDPAVSEFTGLVRYVNVYRSHTTGIIQTGNKVFKLKKDAVFEAAVSGEATFGKYIGTSKVIVDLPPDPA